MNDNFKYREFNIRANASWSGQYAYHPDSYVGGGPQGQATYLGYDCKLVPFEQKAEVLPEILIEMIDRFHILYGTEFSV